MEIPRQQRISGLDALGRWQFTHHPAQPGVRLKAVDASRLDKRVDHRAGVRARWRVREQPSFSSNYEWADRILAAVMPTPRLCRVMNSRTQRLGGSLFPVARIVGIIRESPGRRATDLEVCSVSARHHSPWHARARVP